MSIRNKLGVCIWVEDEATRFQRCSEKIDQAWERLFNEEFDRSECYLHCDWGDSFGHYYSNYRLAVNSYDGWYIYIMAKPEPHKVPKKIKLTKHQEKNA